MSVKKPSKAVMGAYFRALGKKGGKARAESLTPERRSEIARNAAAARKRKLGQDGSFRYTAAPPVETGAE